MNLSDLFTMLSFGELSNLSMSGNGTPNSTGSGQILPAQRPKLVNYTNLALLDLYGRFVLKENDILVQLYDHITFYHLVPRYAISYLPQSSLDDEPIRYLLDLSEEPFADEVLKVRSIHDHRGIQIPLNDEEKHHSCFTPQVKQLQVPNPRQDTLLSVRYQQKHSTLSGNLNEEIACPEILLGALTSYIAYKVFSHMNTADSNAKATEFQTAYEAACAAVTDRDLVNSSISQSNTRFSRGGWR